MTLSKILRSKIGAFLIIIPFVKPATEITGYFDVFFDIWKLFAVVAIICCYINSKPKIEISFLAIIFIQIIYFISTIINRGQLSAAVVQMTSNIAICAYLDYLYNYNEYIAIRNFCLPTTTMAILTTITMFMYYPNGMYQVGNSNYTETSNYLWGFDNATGLLFIPTVFFLIIYSLYLNRKKTYIDAFVLILFFTGGFIYVDSKTVYMMMGMIVFAFVLTVYVKWDVKIANIKTIILSIFFGFVFILIYNDQMNFLWDYARKVNKFYSLKARFIFWGKEIEYFIKSPAIGYGIENKLEIAKKIYIDHPHNFLMDLLYRGGIIAIAMLLLYIFLILKGKIIKDSISIIASFCLLGILITSMLDFYNDFYLFYPQFLLTYFMLKKRKYRLPIKEINNS